MPIPFNSLPGLFDLPPWADPAMLRDMSAVAIVVVAIGALLALGFIRRIIVRTVVLGLLVVLALGLWDQRVQLGECVEECSCTLFGQAVQIPVDRNPRCQRA